MHNWRPMFIDRLQACKLQVSLTVRGFELRIMKARACAADLANAAAVGCRLLRHGGL